MCIRDSGNDSVMIGVCHKDNGTGENKVHYYTGNIRNFGKNDEFENVTFDQIDENAGIFAKELLEKNIVPDVYKRQHLPILRIPSS